MTLKTNIICTSSSECVILQHEGTELNTMQQCYNKHNK